MNSKLKQRLAKRATAVESIMFSGSSPSSVFSFGAVAYKTIKGSYGNTINPFVKNTQDHSQFRLGFNSAKKASRPVKAPVVAE